METETLGLAVPWGACCPAPSGPGRLTPRTLSSPCLMGSSLAVHLHRERARKSPGSPGAGGLRFGETHFRVSFQHHSGLGVGEKELCSLHPNPLNASSSLLRAT